MNLTSRVIERLLKLPPPGVRELVVERDLRVPMADGVELLADRWAPRVGGEGLPTALIRSPYGRRGVFGTVMARPLAERGYQVLLQSTRGGFGSGGTMNPVRQERADGLATLEWIPAQRWFGESIVLVGMSYMGHVQWAVADALPRSVKAMIPHVTESAATLEFVRAESFSLEAVFSWGVMMGGIERRWANLRQSFESKKYARATDSLPLSQGDVAALGHRSDYMQAVLVHDATDPYWSAADHRHRVAEVSVPVSSIGGWYDIFLPGQLRDFSILQDAGRPARLTVGPWTHTDQTNIPVTEAIEFGLPLARGEQPPHRAPVRLYVMGADEWCDFTSWPPEGYEPQRFHLQPQAGLSTEPSGEAELDRYRYDPADPTPALGGVRIARGISAGRVENASLEARSDVLTYTTAVLDRDVEVIGDVTAEIWFRSSLDFADVFVRLCDVDASGRSHNVCDGLVSITGADEITCATVRLWSTAYRFTRGHRIRVQVSSGAFPRYARNTGTGEPLATATRLVAAEQEVHHGGIYHSAIILPVRRVGETA